MNRFKIEQIFDDLGYPEENFVSDRDNLIANYRNPKRFTILELLDLYDVLGPVIRQYKKWKKQYEKGVK